MATDVILFDLDDTLIADATVTEAALRASCAQACACFGLDTRGLTRSARQNARAFWQENPVFDYTDRIGISPSEGLWGHFTGEDPNLTRLREWVPGYRVAVWSQALVEHGIAGSGLADSIAQTFLGERRVRQQIFPETETVLAALRRNYRLALVTNGAPDLQGEKIQWSGLAHYFDSIAISGVLGIGKPDPGIFHYVLGQLGVTPDRAVMVGDNPARDIAGATAAGIRGILIERNQKESGVSGYENCERIETLEQLVGIL